MSRFFVALRITGARDLLEEVIDALGDLSYRLRRQGEPAPVAPDGIQEHNVLLIDLARWERGPLCTAEGDDPTVVLAQEDAQLAAVTTTLRRPTPALAALDRSRCTAELYLSTIRTEEQGGFELPAALVAAVAAAGLSVGVSILVMLADDAPNAVV